MKQWLFLAAAIISEVIATSALKATEDFTKLGPTTIVVIGYALAFYLLTLTLKTIPIGIAYSIWSGAGVALIALVGWMIFEQTLDLPAIIGIVLIVVGVIILNIFSKSVAH